MPDAIKLDVAPQDFRVIHQPCGSSVDKHGSWVAIIHSNYITTRPLDVIQLSEFEILASWLTLQPTVNVTVVCIYRPPGIIS